MWGRDRRRAGPAPIAVFLGSIERRCAACFEADCIYPEEDACPLKCDCHWGIRVEIEQPRPPRSRLFLSTKGWWRR